MVPFHIPEPKRMSGILLFCLLCWQGARGQAPQADPYVLNGSAAQNSCNCYTLTPEENYQAGAVWNKNRIDLNQSFDYHFNIFLGCRTGLNGADGMVFVLQPVSTSLGNSANSLGFGGIIPSLGVTIDTWQNSEDGDPPYDHIAFQANGDVNHDDTNNLAGPVQALAGSPNIKDCAWHILDINWDAVNQILTASIDGIQRLTMHKDLVNGIFRGNGLVFWGFTASTGGEYNLQQFCTSLNAGHSSPANQRFCENIPITFTDSSTSFGSITNWYWDFGDGSTSNAQDPPPHVYATPGVYTIKENVLGNNGCLSDTNFSTVTIGSYPVASFSVDAACSGQPLGILNTSHDTVGTFAQWKWTLSNGQVFSDSLPVIVLSTGNFQLQLATVSAEGCPSKVYTQGFTVSPSPQVTFTPQPVCAGTPLTLTGSSSGTVPIRQWYWKLGAILDSNQTIEHTFSSADTILASLWAFSAMGCSSDTVQQAIQIQGTDAFAGPDTAVALGYPIQLHATGGTSYVWSPPGGLSDPDIANPVANIQQDTRYTVTASSPAGCVSSASVLIKVFKGPAIYVPGGFTPNGDGFNDVLKIVAPGISQLNYFRIFDRWGTEVFHTKDLNATWDGTYSGHSLSSGTYIWMIQGTDFYGKTLTEKGTTLLLR